MNRALLACPIDSLSVGQSQLMLVAILPIDFLSLNLKDPQACGQSDQAVQDDSLQLLSEQST